MPVKAYLQLFLQIILLNRGPQDVPFSRSLFRFSIGLYFLTGLASQLTVDSLYVALASMLLDVTLLLVYARALLAGFGKAARFNQMGSCLLLVGSLFQLVDWPLLNYLQQAEAADTRAPMVSLLLLLLMSWNLAVYAHIIRHSLDVRMPVAFVLTLMYVVMAILSRQLFVSLLGA